MSLSLKRRSPGSNKSVDACSFFSPPFFHILGIFWNWSPQSRFGFSGENLYLNIQQLLCCFPCKKTNKKTFRLRQFNFVYFSFLPCERNGRVFQETSERGGCDSLPLVAESTSKQRESPLSYALHFLRIISPQMCCAGERGLGLLNSPQQWLIKRRDSITTACQREGQHVRCFYVHLQSQTKTVRGEKHDSENMPTARPPSPRTL